MRDIEAIFGTDPSAPLFVVRLDDISQELAGLLIHDIQDCKELSNVLCIYNGSYKTGSVEFIINPPRMSCYSYKDNEVVSDINYRHVATELCAALGNSLCIRVPPEEQHKPFNSVLSDRMFSLKLFNCISARLRIIENSPKNIPDYCDSCVGGECTLRKYLFDPFDRRLRLLIQYKFDQLNFISYENKSGWGLLTAKFSTFDGLMDMFDIEEFLDVNGLFRWQSPSLT